MSLRPRATSHTRTIEALVVVAAVLASGCSTPPDREIALARDALEHARSVGADRLAPQQFASGTAALDEAVEAVRVEDYRLALSRAIAARERAEAAAAAAVARRATLRAEVEAMLEAIASARAETQARLDAAGTDPAATASLGEARAVVATIDELVQEARSALERGDDHVARDRLIGVLEQLRAVGDELQDDARRPVAPTSL